MEKQVEYYEKLNIDLRSINEIKDIIKKDIILTLKCWENGNNVDRQSFHIVGPAGTGKTQIMEQLKIELSKETGKDFGLIMIKAPVITRDDFLIPFPKKDSDKFEMLYSDFIPPDDQEFGLYIIDEFFRGDNTLKQLLWQVQNEQKIHMKNFPAGWFVISTDNPDTEEYSIDNDEDAAGLRRHLHIYVDVSSKDFLKYANDYKLHPLVIEYIQSYPERLYDFKSQKIGAVYANPASWEKISGHLWKSEMGNGIENNISHLTTIFSGLININSARMFIAFIKDHSNIIKPIDIINDFGKIQPTLQKLLDNNDNATISNLMGSFMTFLTSNMLITTENQNNNIALFLMAMPIDTAAIFIRILDNFEKSSKEFLYMTKLQINLNKNKDFRTKFYEPLIRLIRS